MLLGADVGTNLAYAIQASPQDNFVPLSAEELFVLDDLQLLKDIKEGPSDEFLSRPLIQRIEFEGRSYFVLRMCKIRSEERRVGKEGRSGRGP